MHLQQIFRQYKHRRGDFQIKQWRFSWEVFGKLKQLRQHKLYKVWWGVQSEHMGLNSARHQCRLPEQQLKSMWLSQWILSWAWANRVFSLWIKWTTAWATLGREHGQHTNGNYYLPLFSDSEFTPGIMCPLWGSPVQEGCQETGDGHAEDWWNSKWPTAYNLWRYWE